MPVIFNQSSIKSRIARRRSQSKTRSFSWVIFLIAVCHFTVWSLGVSACATQSEQTQVIEYFVSNAAYAQGFASVLLILQSLTLSSVIPAFALYLLISHHHYLSPSPFSPPLSITGFHTAEINKLPVDRLNPSFSSSNTIIGQPSEETAEDNKFE